MDELYFTDDLRQHVFSLPPDQVFTTRDLLVYARRGIVDKMLWRLVHAGFIQRLARGVFVREITDRVTPLVVATAKLAAFGKTICPHQSNIDAKLCVEGGVVNPLLYRTDGKSSSFDTVFGRMHISHAAARKRRLVGSRALEMISAVWDKVLRGMPFQNAVKRLGFISRIDRVELRSNIQWMPHWLGDTWVYGPLPKVFRERLRTMRDAERQRLADELNSISIYVP